MKSYILSGEHGIFQRKIDVGGGSSLSLEVMHQSFGSSFRDFFVKATKESEQAF